MIFHSLTYALFKCAYSTRFRRNRKNFLIHQPYKLFLHFESKYVGINIFKKSFLRLERMPIARHDIYSKGDRISAYKTKASIFVAFIHKVKDKEKDFL